MCMYVRVCICVYVCVCIVLYVCVCLCMYACMHTSSYLATNARIWLCLRRICPSFSHAVEQQALTYINFVCMYLHRHIYMHTHTQKINTYTYTKIPTRSRICSKCVCIYICVYIYVYINMHTYIICRNTQHAPRHAVPTHLMQYTVLICILSHTYRQGINAHTSSQAPPDDCRNCCLSSLRKCLRALGRSRLQFPANWQEWQNPLWI